jgi:hypothetical protein
MSNSTFFRFERVKVVSHLTLRAFREPLLSRTCPIRQRAQSRFDCQSSGLPLAENPDCFPNAFVGSELDNGKIVTDSPERDGMAFSVLFTVVKRPTVNG